MLDRVFGRAAAVLHKSAAVAIVFTSPAGVISGISAVKYDEQAEQFEGPGRSMRIISFELQQGDVPTKPEKGDRIREVAAARSWAVKETTRRDDIGAWWVIVSAVAA